MAAVVVVAITATIRGVMAIVDTDLPEKATEPAIEQALPVQAAILAPTLAVVVEVLQKLIDDLTPHA